MQKNNPVVIVMHHDRCIKKVSQLAAAQHPNQHKKGSKMQCFDRKNSVSSVITVGFLPLKK